MVLVRQDEVGVTVFARLDEATWKESKVTGFDDALVLAGLGTICQIRYLYRGMNLAD